MRYNFNLFDYLENNGVENLTDRGNYIMGSCPYPDHPDNSPSWSIFSEYPYSWTCFGCHKKGTLKTLKRELGFHGVIPGEHDPLEEEAKTETKLLKDRIKNLGIDKSDVVVRQHLPKGFVPIEESKMKDMVYEYLDKRGVLDEILLNRKYYRCGVSDEYPGYIILPIFENGLCVYWTGRSFIDVGKSFRFKNPKKHTNTLGKSEFLYSPYLPQPSIKHGIIVEGQFDVIKLLSFRLNVVGTFNASPSRTQIRKISKLFNAVTILYDDDTAGNMGAIQLGVDLNELGVYSYRMKTINAEDAGDYKCISDFVEDFKKKEFLM